MIKGFSEKETEALWNGSRHHFPSDIARRALIKLQLINAAAELDFLRLPPGNRLEPLTGRRKGQHSIRINDQWRICFRWEADGASDVEITDYH